MNSNMSAPPTDIPIPPPSVRAQAAALARLRWQIFRNSLRTIHGRLELVSRIFTGLSVSALLFGAAVGVGIGSYFSVAYHRPELLLATLWGIFLYWQLFPILATAFATVFDSSNLLRFPIRFSSFFILSLSYGLADPSAVAGCLWLASMAAGIGAAAPQALTATLPVLFLFAAVNLLLGRAVFAWLERWLARRRTREILGVVFICVILSFQLIAPIVEHWKHHPGNAVAGLASVLRFQLALPPGLAGAAIVRILTHQTGPLLFSAGLLVYGAVFACLLGWRLLAQFRGENLGETAVARAALRPAKVQSGWDVHFLPPAVVAVFEKEIRYLSRSGPVLFSMIVPVFVLVIFRVSPSHGAGQQRFHAQLAQMAFPVGAAYALLVLTNLVYNCFGTDAAGIQFYFMAPVDFRTILIGKNLAHTLLLAAETLLVWLGATLLYGPPPSLVTLATLIGLIFALEVNLGAGNLLSIYFPKKYDFATFGRQRASPTAVWASMGIQAIIIGLAGLTFFLCYRSRRLWLAALILALLAVVAFAVYKQLLRMAAGVMLQRRELFATELCRT